jgi:cyclophilin family peptidyl-prolyl cis-trans isomerase
MFVRTLFAFLLCLSGGLTWAAAPQAPAAAPPAAAPPAPAAGNKAEEFAKIHKEYNDLVTNLKALKAEYDTSNDTARKTEIYKQYNEGLAKADAIVRKLIAAAESAYAEAPNADPKVTDVLVRVLADDVKRDDYEPAFQLGKTLMDKKCAVKDVPALAGAAAYCVNEYDLAKSWLSAAKADGNLSEEFEHYLASLDDTKDGWAKEKKIREAEAKANDLPRVLMKTSQGDVEIELFENEAPNTVLNFITLVDKGFYNGLKFHRVIPAFMAQGGDPQGNGQGGPGYNIPCECYQDNHRLHFRGSLSMAHAGRDTGGSQFFLTFVPTKHLDGKHTVFGRVVSGFDVLAKLKRRNPEDPGTADTILEAKVTRRRPHPYDVKDLKKSTKSD